MEFKFKSAGTKVSHRKFKVTKDQAKNMIKPIGIKTPVRLGKENTELFDCHTHPLDQIKDNLKNIIKTNKGERLCRYDFGVDLNSFLFERVYSSDMNRQIEENIQNQIKKYLPIVIIDEVQINHKEIKNRIEDGALARIVVDIKFSVPALKFKNQKILVEMYVGG